MTVYTNPATAAGDDADRYISATLALLGDRVPADVLAHTVDALREMILGVDPAVLARPEVPGKWSVNAVIAHLADSELVWSNRLRRVLAENRPELIGYDQDLWAARLGYDERDVVADLDLFDVVRRANLALLARTDETDMSRTGFHQERGEETVEHMIGLYAGHDLVHLAQARRILGSTAPAAVESHLGS